MKKSPVSSRTFFIFFDEIFAETKLNRTFVIPNQKNGTLVR